MQKYNLLPIVQAPDHFFRLSVISKWLNLYAN
jgi:hypothetical protein